MQRLETAATMRDWGRRRGVIDKCLKEYDVDIVFGPADSALDNHYTAAGYPAASVPLSYSSFNGRPFGLVALASQYQEGALIQFMSAWQCVFNRDRVLPAWISGDPNAQLRQVPR
jgi:amidase